MISMDKVGKEAFQKQDKRWIQGMDTLRFLLAVWVVVGHHTGIKDTLAICSGSKSFMDLYMLFILSRIQLPLTKFNHCL